MFVVKRPFKSFGKAYVVGSVITDPSAVKRFKGKLAEGKIIEVTEQTYETVAKYFKVKYNVSLPPISVKPEESMKSEEPKESEEHKTVPVAKVSVASVK